jgi:aminopeptidase N
MTRQLAALACLLTIGKGADQLETFRGQWQHDRLVMNKWFGLQVARAAPDRAADVAEALTHDPDFTWRNPNRFRAVFGSLAANAAGFHHPSGKGYRLLGDWLARLDAVNPQTAARMSTAFETWRRYDADRQAQIRAVLEGLDAKPDLSRDSAEMVQRMLSGAD